MRKTRKLRKWLLTAACLLATVAVSVGATIAYLTDAEEVTNTFTVGNVSIDLNETDVDEDGSTKANDYHLVPGQTYVKNPTVTIKANSEPSYVRMLVTVEDYGDLFTATSNHESEIDNPTVQIKELAYPNNPLIRRVNLAAYMDISPNWTLTSTTFVSSPVFCVTYEYRYMKTTEKKAQDDDLPALFTQLTIPGCFTNDELLALKEGYAWHGDAQGNYSVVELGATHVHGHPFKITVKAEAIQAAGFADADAAWAAFELQHP